MYCYLLVVEEMACVSCLLCCSTSLAILGRELSPSVPRKLWWAVTRWTQFRTRTSISVYITNIQKAVKRYAHKILNNY